jgi:hypothetical protein
LPFQIVRFLCTTKTFKNSNPAMFISNNHIFTNGKYSIFIFNFTRFTPINKCNHQPINSSTFHFSLFTFHFSLFKNLQDTTLFRADRLPAIKKESSSPCHAEPVSCHAERSEASKQTLRFVQSDKILQFSESCKII